jgi:NADPH-dependent curcumin reductase CurA
MPDGLPKPEHFDVVETPLPAPADGEFLVRNRYFHVSPALRSLMSGGIPNAGFPGLFPGDVLFGATIGEVVSAPEDSTLRPGDLVSHWQGWREFAAVPAAQLVPLGDALPDPVAHLAQGLTAYGALTRGVQVKPGDTVFVSGAAGSVGTLAGQIARLLGAGRVVGSAGTKEKADWLVRELGYDAVIVRGAGPIAEQLAKAAPDGIDVYFDNVGGEQLQAAIASARQGASFVLVGALSGQLAADTAGTSAPVEVDSYELILKRIKLRGFSGLDHPEVQAEWTERFAGWLASGDIVFPTTRVVGIERARDVLHEVIDGQHTGTVIVEL